MEVTKNVKRAGIALIAITGLIHLFLAPEYFEEYDALYGAAFVLNFLAAVGIYRDERNWDWVLGAAIAAGAFGLYVASTTVGLPGGVSEPLELVGILSLIIESGFVLVFVKAVPRSTSEPRTNGRDRRVCANVVSGLGRQASICRGSL